MIALRLFSGAASFGCFSGAVDCALAARTASDAVALVLSQTFLAAVLLGAVLALVALCTGRGATNAAQPMRYCVALDGDRNRNRSRNRF